MGVAGRALRANMTTLGPLVLPLSEKLLFAGGWQLPPSCPMAALAGRCTRPSPAHLTKVALPPAPHLPRPLPPPPHRSPPG